MTKSIKNIIITGLLLTFSVQAQDRSAAKVTKVAGSVAQGNVVKSSRVVPVQPVVAPAKAASVTLKPETPSFFTKLSNAASWCSQKLTSIGNGVQKTSAAVYDNRYLFGTAAVVTLWQLNKLRIRNNIRAKIERPNLESCAIITQRKKEFNWATWRKYTLVANSNHIYANPSDLNALTADQLLNLIDTDLKHNSMTAFLSNGKESLRLEDNTNNFALGELNILLADIRREKNSLLADLDYLALELDVDRVLPGQCIDSNYEHKVVILKYLGVYVRSIITPNWLNNFITKNYCKTVQDKIRNKFFVAINLRSTRHAPFSRLDQLYLLSGVHTENLTAGCPRKQFVADACGYSGLLFSKEAASLYFDVAVAYGRLRALELKVMEKLETLGQAV